MLTLPFISIRTFKPFHRIHMVAPILSQSARNPVCHHPTVKTQHHSYRSFHLSSNSQPSLPRLRCNIATPLTARKLHMEAQRQYSDTMRRLRCVVTFQSGCRQYGIYWAPHTLYRLYFSPSMSTYNAGRASRSLESFASR